MVRVAPRGRVAGGRGRWKEGAESGGDGEVREDGDGGCGPVDSLGSRFSLTDGMVPVCEELKAVFSCCGGEAFWAAASDWDEWRAWEIGFVAVMGRLSSGFLL